MTFKLWSCSFNVYFNTCVNAQGKLKSSCITKIYRKPSDAFCLCQSCTRRGFAVCMLRNIGSRAPHDIKFHSLPPPCLMIPARPSIILGQIQYRRPIAHPTDGQHARASKAGGSEAVTAVPPGVCQGALAKPKSASRERARVR